MKTSMSTKSRRVEWLAPDEAEIERWTAAVPTLGGRGAKYGGQLVLTSRRLVWQPLRIRALMVADGHVLPIDAGGQWWELALTDIDHVEPDPKRRALLHIVSRDGMHTSFLVTAGHFGPVWSKKNQAARDAAIVRISARLDSARA